jgi:predicted aspartyl protease
MALIFTGPVTRYDDVPSIPLIVRHGQAGNDVQIEAYIDTGADGTLLDETIAQALGIDLSAGNPARVRGVGGGFLPGRMALIELVFEREETLIVPVVATFAAGVLESVGNLLGLDVWTALDLGLSHSTRSVYLGLPR